MSVFVGLSVELSPRAYLRNHVQPSKKVLRMLPVARRRNHNIVHLRFVDDVILHLGLVDTMPLQRRIRRLTSLLHLRGLVIFKNDLACDLERSFE